MSDPEKGVDERMAVDCPHRHQGGTRCSFPCTRKLLSLNADTCTEVGWCKVQATFSQHFAIEEECARGGTALISVALAKQGKTLPAKKETPPIVDKLWAKVKEAHALP